MAKAPKRAGWERPQGGTSCSALIPRKACPVPSPEPVRLPPAGTLPGTPPPPFSAQIFTDFHGVCHDRRRTKGGGHIPETR